VVARLAQQWTERTRNELFEHQVLGVLCIYVVAHLARQWIKRTRNELFGR